MRVITPVEQRWTADEWWPRFARLPIDKLAVVVAEDAFNRVAVDRIIVRASASTPVRHPALPVVRGSARVV